MTTPTTSVARRWAAPLPLRVARRIARSGELRRSTFIIFLSAAFLLAMYVVLDTLSLSGAQVADRDLGRYELSVGYGSVIVPAGDQSFVNDLRDSIGRAGLTDAQVALSATDVQLPTTPARNITLLEMNWTTSPYPERYALTEGRWPSAPREVVVTDTSDFPATVGSDLPVLGGRVVLRVVGTADDRYARSSNLLAAPGTWSVIPTNTNDAFPTLGAQPYLLADGADVDLAVNTFAAAVQRRIDADPTTSNTATPSAVAASAVTRTEVLQRPERTWIDRSPAGYTIPSLLLPLIAVLLVYGLNDRRLRRTTAQLHSLGLTSSVATLGPVLAILGWCLAMAAAGSAAGIGIGALLRPIIADIRDKPAGPVNGLALPLLQLAALTIATTVAVGIARLRPQPPRTPAPHSEPAKSETGRPERLIRDLRHLAAVAISCVAAVVAFSADTPPKAMVLSGLVAAAVLLAVPDITNRVTRLLPERGPRSRLAHRQMTADTTRISAAVAVLALLLGASIGYVILLSTMIRTADQQNYPDVLPGQVLLVSRSSAIEPPPPAVLQTVDRLGKLGDRPRTRLTYAINTDNTGAVTRSATLPGRDGNILLVDTADQAQQLTGSTLTAAQRSVLDGGGLLQWSDVPGAPMDGASETTLVVREHDTIVNRTAPLPTTAIEVGLSGWRIGTDGVVLTETARALNLPVSRPGPILVTGLSDQQAEAAHQAVERAGLDARTVQYYIPPKPAIPPAALIATAIALVALVLLVSLSAARSQTRTLRDYLHRLVAIGISPRWTRQVVAYQHLAVTAISTALGLLIAAVPVAVLVWQAPGFVLDIPWGQLVILIACIYTASGLSLYQALRKVSASS